MFFIIGNKGSIFHGPKKYSENTSLFSYLELPSAPPPIQKFPRGIQNPAVQNVLSTLDIMKIAYTANLFITVKAPPILVGQPANQNSSTFNTIT